MPDITTERGTTPTSVDDKINLAFALRYSAKIRILTARYSNRKLFSKIIAIPRRKMVTKMNVEEENQRIIFFNINGREARERII